jgi:UDPglucose 6-dehydrogenase
MKIVVIGTGYVGLVSGACFSEMGNHVTCLDIDTDKIAKLNKGIIPIYEPGLQSIVQKNVAAGNLFFSTAMKDEIHSADIVFIAVGTPMGEDGSADLQYVLKVAKSIGQHIQQPIIIVNKSTVPVGTADKVREAIEHELIKRNISVDFEVVSNPEFLKEGAAINDFMKPDRVIIGTDNKEVIKKLKRLYAPFCMSHERFITMDVRSAEMTKYAANAMLATRISFMNEIANICEKVGADANQVRIGIGSDNRIGYSFIYPGCGYGGSCFPKDVRALQKTAQDYGMEAMLISSVERVNNLQKGVISQKIISKFGKDLSGLTFAIWGLSFKPGTDDMREAPSLFVSDELNKRGASFKVYDPKAMQEAKSHYLNTMEHVEYVGNKYQALMGADALVLLTEWKEFRSPEFDRIKELLKNPIIFDGRNQYHMFGLEEKGFEYYQIGKK